MNHASYRRTLYTVTSVVGVNLIILHMPHEIYSSVPPRFACSIMNHAITHINTIFCQWHSHLGSACAVLSQISSEVPFHHIVNIRFRQLCGAHE